MLQYQSVIFAKISFQHCCNVSCLLGVLRCYNVSFSRTFLEGVQLKVFCLPRSRQCTLGISNWQTMYFPNIVFIFHRFLELVPCFPRRPNRAHNWNFYFFWTFLIFIFWSWLMCKASPGVINNKWVWFSKIESNQSLQSDQNFINSLS